MYITSFLKVLQKQAQLYSLLNTALWLETGQMYMHEQWAASLQLHYLRFQQTISVETLLEVEIKISSLRYLILEFLL